MRRTTRFSVRTPPFYLFFLLFQFIYLFIFAETNVTACFKTVIKKIYDPPVIFGTIEGIRTKATFFISSHQLFSLSIP